MTDTPTHPTTIRRTAEIEDARAAGLTWNQVADEQGISLAMLEKWCRRNGHPDWAAGCYRAR